MVEAVRFELVKLAPCIICADPVIYAGPTLLQNGPRICSPTCDRIWNAITPGIWIDASELAPGGSLNNRPELWSNR